MKKFPYYKQETNYTCGAACMRMALEFFNIIMTEKQIAKLLGTNRVSGTRNKNFPIIAEKLKLSYIAMRNGTINDLMVYKKKGFIIITCFFYPPDKTGHYSILKKINSKLIFFWDPFLGENHKYKISYFEKNWKGDPKYDGEKRWFFGIKKQ
jgi:ABC-type bacteriocin/lantibiotic exporter with double-glycine peptidase domain